MIKNFQLRIDPETAADSQKIKLFIAAEKGWVPDRIQHLKILKRSIDARKKDIKINITLDAYIDEPYLSQNIYQTKYLPLQPNKKIFIIGAGPSGLFAALRLLEAGIKPVILERGKNVKDRRRDLAALNKNHIVNPDSNYCFGEGGAGTYSDGKLYTRSNKRGDTNKILEIFHEHGASENILVEAHPHIGTNKLPHIIENMREVILAHGGEIYFNTRVTDFVVAENKIKEIITVNTLTNETTSFEISNDVALCTGHSARDIFKMLHRNNILIEAKPFAVGVRVEHPQSLIDSIQYHCSNSDEREYKRNYLPAAAYSLVSQINNRGVYSFCMCPGGVIAPCATDKEQVVTNGWSPSKRNNPFANSGVVTGIELEDLSSYKMHGVFAGMMLQEEMEFNAWKYGGKTQAAPAQRLIDFTKDKLSSSLPDCSYHPGIVSSPLNELMPSFISQRLKSAFIDFGKKVKGYLSNDAVVVAFETRTSSPIRIPRTEKLHHPQINNLYPCAEGAGYAGGIVSAAMDGRKIAEAIILS